MNGKPWILWAWLLALTGSILWLVTLAGGHGSPRSSRWAAVRAAHLARFPECAACCSRSDLTVHHVKPFHEFPELELDPGNLITLCGPDRTPENGVESRDCHLHFGHLCADRLRVSWTCGNPNVRRDAAAFRRRLLSGVSP